MITSVKVVMHAFSISLARFDHLPATQLLRNVGFLVSDIFEIWQIYLSSNFHVF